MLKIKIDKTLKQVKDSQRQERGKTSHKTYLKSLKGDILSGIQLSVSSIIDNYTPSTSSTDNSTPSTSFATNNFTTKSSDTHIQGVGEVAMLGIYSCLFFYI